MAISTNQTRPSSLLSAGQLSLKWTLSRQLRQLQPPHQMDASHWPDGGANASASEGFTSDVLAVPMFEGHQLAQFR